MKINYNIHPIKPNQTKKCCATTFSFNTSSKASYTKKCRKLNTSHDRSGDVTQHPAGWSSGQAHHMTGLVTSLSTIRGSRRRHTSAGWSSGRGADSLAARTSSCTLPCALSIWPPFPAFGLQGCCARLDHLWNVKQCKCETM